MNAFVSRSSLLAITAALLSVRIASGTELFTAIEQHNPFAQRQQTSDTASSLSDTVSGSYEHGALNVAYGAISASGNVAVPVGGNTQLDGRCLLDGRFKTTITINSPGHAGSATARFTFHVTGDLSAGASGGASSTANYFANAQGTYNQLFGFSGTTGSGGSSGTPVDTLRTFTSDATFYYGNPLDLMVRFGINTSVVDTYIDGGSATANLSLTMDQFTVVDANNQPVDYTATSANGSARGMNVAGGTTLDTFALTNAGAFGHGTTFATRGGTASAGSYLSASFGPAPNTDTPLASDVIGFSGTGSDVVVLEMSYDPATAQALGLTEAGLRLGWFDPVSGKWRNAVAGNNGGTPTFFNRAYNPATDFHLGYFGVDTTNKTAWAVVNHNSIFGVAAVPPPLTLLSAVSRKVHTDAGPFDINLPLSGNVGVECRRSSANNDHQIILTFSGPVTSVGSMNLSATKGGSVSNTTINGATVTIDLTGVANEQIISLDVLQATNGTETTSSSVSMGVLLGDVNGDGTVNSGDATVVRSRSGRDTDATNFRADVNSDGGVNSADATIVRGRSGTTILNGFSTSAAQKSKGE